ncbi:hypothetical protein [Chromobacterium sphagni]|uniref:hypothetical protein n=1 Tax=Chromobacterium sphagni TaxID=1903179 RepID=UPI0011133CC7|nr:hypothetical protein [Chromobacterium sphagni]
MTLRNGQAGALDDVPREMAREDRTGSTRAANDLQPLAAQLGAAQLGAAQLGAALNAGKGLPELEELMGEV